MKKFLAILLLGLFLLPSLALAAEFRSGSLPQKETVFGDLYMADETVKVEGKVQGDLVAFGNNLAITNKVDKDLLAAAQTLNLKGVVGDTARLAGGTVTIEGECFGDLLVAGGVVEITPKAKIHGDLIAAGSTVNLNGDVQGKTKIYGGKVSLNGRLSGPVEVKTNSLEIGSNAYIQGNLNYQAPQEAKIDSQAKILGKKEYKATTETEKRKHKLPLFSLWGIMKLLATIVFALILVYLFPQKSKRILELSKIKFWSSLGIGFLVLFATPIVALILFMTGIGFLFGLMMILVYILLVVLACVYAGVILGAGLLKWIRKKKEYKIGWPDVVIGVILLNLIKIIPILGGIFAFILVILVLGSLVNFDCEILKNLKDKKMV